IMGTPAYMPAEQALGDAVDERADVYALGALLYHVLAGAPPYTGKSTDEILDRVIQGPPRALAEAAPGVPAELGRVGGRVMAHEAADRSPAAKQLVDDLKKFQTGQLVGAHRYSTFDHVRRWVRRNRAYVGASAIALIVIAVIAAISVRRVVRERDA